MTTNAEPLIKALFEISNRLLSLASSDDEFRLQLRQLAHALLEATDVPQQEVVAPVELSIAVEPSTDQMPVWEVEPVAPVEVEPQVPESAESLLSRLTLGRGKPIVEPQTDATPNPPQRTQIADTDLAVIESRCRIKAEGARWAANRNSLLNQGASFQIEIAPMDGDIVSRARAIPDCFLWMCHRTGPSPTNLSLWQDVSECFETLGDGLSLLRRVQSQSKDGQAVFEGTLDLFGRGSICASLCHCCHRRSNRQRSSSSIRLAEANRR